MPSANNANRNAAKTSWRVVNYSLSKNDDVKLKTCENAWAPPCIKRKIASDSTDDNSTEVNIDYVFNRKVFPMITRDGQLLTLNI
jgi:hypothetical protein